MYEVENETYVQGYEVYDKIASVGTPVSGVNYLDNPQYVYDPATAVIAVQQYQPNDDNDRIDGFPRFGRGDKYKAFTFHGFVNSETTYTADDEAIKAILFKT
jgi:hypothetical protein